MVGAREGYYPGEVARLLDADLDYRQLRRLYAIVLAQSGKTLPEGWLSLSAQEIFALRKAFELAGGSPGTQRGRRRRLAFRRVERACARLRELYGVANPLTDVEMSLVGTEVFVTIDGAVLEPISRQRVFDVVRNAGKTQQMLASKGAPKTKGQATSELREAASRILAGNSNLRTQIPIRISLA